jgi:predicted  nucleic acid-binding Zn-ribbon protein
MVALQKENDELHETLAKKQQQNESLRSDLESLQSKFDALTVTKASFEQRLDQSVAETTFIRNHMASAPQNDPVFLQSEILRLTKALETKTKDFEYVSARYQDASAAAVDSATEVTQLKAELEKLKRRVETDVKAVSWEGEKKVLLEKINDLEGRCKLLEQREEKVQLKQADGGKST